jgi:hypothetical protein
MSSKVQSRHTPTNNFGNNAHFNGKQFSNSFTQCSSVKNQNQRILAAPFQPTALANKIINLSLSTTDSSSDETLRFSIIVFIEFAVVLNINS